MAKQGLASIGIDVKVNSVAMNYVTEIPDIGGKPDSLDATCMKDEMKKTVPGVQDTPDFEVTYLYDNSATDSDYRVLKALEVAKNIVPIEISFPDGTKFSNTCYVTTYVSGVGVNALVSAKLSCNLQSEWTVTNPAASGT